MADQNPKVDAPPPFEHGEGSGRLGLRRGAYDGRASVYLKTLAEQLGEPNKFSRALTKAEASKRIDELKASLERKRSKRP